jgi:hypothetical protein
MAPYLELPPNTTVKAYQWRSLREARTVYDIGDSNDNVGFVLNAHGAGTSGDLISTYDFNQTKRTDCQRYETGSQADRGKPRPAGSANCEIAGDTSGQGR